MMSIFIMNMLVQKIKQSKDKKNILQKIKFDKLDCVLTFTLSLFSNSVVFHMLNQCHPTIESALGIC
jgi:hypothetical protein